MMLFLAVAALGLSALLTYIIARPASPLSVLDVPEDRSLHSTPVPSGGGIAILVAAFLCCALALFLFNTGAKDLLWLCLGSGALAAVSYIDDRRYLPISIRLAVHFLIAGVLVAGGIIPDIFPQHLAGLSTVLAILGTVWFINLYNFMDGMDGFAAGMTVSGFAFFAYMGWIRGAPLFATVALCLSLASLGFLLFNFPPARIFMGDVGSIPLGFLASGLSLWGIRDGIFSWWAPLLIFSPFIVDATVTLLRRIFQGEKFWQAHCSHYYQRLVLLGWGHKKTVLYEYALMAAAGLSAVLLEQSAVATPVALGLTLWTVLFIVIAILIRQLETSPRNT